MRFLWGLGFRTATRLMAAKIMRGALVAGALLPIARSARQNVGIVAFGQELNVPAGV